MKVLGPFRVPTPEQWTTEYDLLTAFFFERNWLRLARAAWRAYEEDGPCLLAVPWRAVLTGADDFLTRSLPFPSSDPDPDKYDPRQHVAVVFLSDAAYESYVIDQATDLKGDNLRVQISRGTPTPEA